MRLHTLPVAIDWRMWGARLAALLVTVALVNGEVETSNKPTDAEGAAITKPSPTILAVLWAVRQYLREMVETTHRADRQAHLYMQRLPKAHVGPTTDELAAVRSAIA